MTISRFTARLRPSQSGAPGLRAGDNAEQQLRRDFAGTRVLLVEDDPINQIVAAELLQDVGLVTDIAECGRTALAQVEHTRYALILMDMQMPDLDGLETTRLLRQGPHARGIPIIALTANAFLQDRQACLAAGMDDFLAKPVDPEALFDTLLRWLPFGQARGDAEMDRPTA